MSRMAVAVLYAVRPVADGLVITFRPRELNETNARGFVSDLLDLARDAPGSTLYLDLSRVRFATKYVWLRLPALHCELKAAGRRLCLVRPTRSFIQLLRAVHLADILDVRTKEDGSPGSAPVHPPAAHGPCTDPDGTGSRLRADPVGNRPHGRALPAGRSRNTAR